MVKRGGSVLNNPTVKRMIKVATNVAAGAATAAISSSMKPEADQKGNTITTTDQAVTQYKKKKASKKRQRKNKKQYKTFVKNALKLVGTNIAVLNDQQAPPALSTQQGINVVTLGGKSWALNDNEEIGSNDMRRVMGADDRLEKVVNNTKTLITSASCDITYRNIGSGAIEVDMYTITHYGTRHLQSCVQDIARAQNVTPGPPGNTGTDPTIVLQRGMQLFDFPIFSTMGNKIIEKKKFVIPAGGVITHRFSTRKNVWFSSQETALAPITEGTTTALPGSYVKTGFTKSVFFVYKPVIGNASSSAHVTLGATRRYNYKIFADNRDFNTYNPT